MGCQAVMRNVQGRPDSQGQILTPAYFERFGEHFKSDRVPFGAYEEFLPASVQHDDLEAKMAPGLLQASLLDITKALEASHLTTA